MEIQENMAAVIHALKEKRGQSLTELSEDLEISRSALQEYLAGNGNPTLATVEHLAERLGIPSVALVSGTLPSGQFDVLMTLLDSLKLLSGLSADQRRRFTELLGEMLTLWEGAKPVKDEGIFVDFRIAASYRIPMSVVSLRRYSGRNGIYAYPICPRCNTTLPREYLSFCDRCGQRLNWKHFAKATIID